MYLYEEISRLMASTVQYMQGISLFPSFLFLEDTYILMLNKLIGTMVNYIKESHTNGNMLVSPSSLFEDPSRRRRCLPLIFVASLFRSVSTSTSIRSSIHSSTSAIIAWISTCLFQYWQALSMLIKSNMYWFDAPSLIHRLDLKRYPLAASINSLFQPYTLQVWRGFIPCLYHSWLLRAH